MRFKLCLLLLVVSIFLSIDAFAVSETRDGNSATSKELTYDQIRSAASGGDADAQYALGYLYFYGKNGAPKDAALAKIWIEKAAKQKQVQAVKALALINNRSEASSPQDVHNVVSTIAHAPVEEETLKKQTALMKQAKSIQSEKENLVVVRQKKSLTSDKNQNGVNPGIYTLQLLGAFNRDTIKTFVNKNHLEGRAKLYENQLRGRPWYVLTYGEYGNKKDARIVAEKLECKLSVKPWVRPSATLKSSHSVAED